LKNSIKFEGGHPYQKLTPDIIIEALSALGLRVDGRLSALGSYENRVYLAMLEDSTAVVTKFYRPGRWSEEQILEEHAFAADLIQAEIPVVAPLSIHGTTLHNTSELGLDLGVDFWFSVCPKKGGRLPDLDDHEVLVWLGRYLARIHNIGQVIPFIYREKLDLQTMGVQSKETVINLACIPDQFVDRWTQVCEQALERVKELMQGAYSSVRLHGDCHLGNILWTPPNLEGAGPHFVDLDDASMGPCIQDLWMLQSGDRQERTYQLSSLLEGYTQMREFNQSELRLIEPLRTLRIIHYSAWLAKRADDPAFFINFPWFWGADYWQTQIDTLLEQLQAMDEEPLSV